MTTEVKVWGGWQPDIGWVDIGPKIAEAIDLRLTTHKMIAIVPMVIENSHVVSVRIFFQER